MGVSRFLTSPVGYVMLVEGQLTMPKAPNLEALDIQFAIDIAVHAGQVLAQRPESLQISTKSSSTDVVTHMDEQSERYIVEQIRRVHPTDGILGEEGTSVASTSGRTWIIDPLDGTVNYLYGIPYWAVSIGLRNDVTGEGILGVVYAPDLDALYVSASGEGAWKLSDGNWIRIAVSQCADLGQALMGTGFGYAISRRIKQSQVLTHVLPSVRDIRRLGSCAIDLCLVASGELDGFFEEGVNPWDHSAGSLMVREAGGRVSGLFGTQESDSMLLATTGNIYLDLLRILEAAESETV
jgi:myo-inositol-1(or 4)-monophosphatase